jgi:hypothetical protein
MPDGAILCPECYTRFYHIAGTDSSCFGPDASDAAQREYAMEVFETGMRHLLSLMPTATVMAFAQLITVQYWRNQGIGRHRDRVWFRRKEKKGEQLNRDLFDGCVNDEDHVGWKGGTVQLLGNNAVTATAGGDDRAGHAHGVISHADRAGMVISQHAPCSFTQQRPLEHDIC